MRVSIEHREEQKGMFRKTTYHVVDLQVQFNEEEKQTVRENDLGDVVILEREPQAGVIGDRSATADIFHLRIRHIVNGKTESYACNTPREAKVYEQQLTEALTLLKQYLSEHSEVEEKSKSFEL